MGIASSTGASNLPKIIHKTNTSVQGERVEKYAFEQHQNLNYCIAHCSLFIPGAPKAFRVTLL